MSNPDEQPARPLLCPQCQRTYLTGRQCKLVCVQCGYVESCEDLTLGQQAQARPPASPERTPNHEADQA